MATDNYGKILKELGKLHKKFPSYNLGRHLATALDGYDTWSTSDKEMLFAIEKYEAGLEFDIHRDESRDIDAIIKDGVNFGLLVEGLYDGEEE